MDIGAKIKSLRLENQLTQEELANRCELSKGFISLLERDLTSPSIATLIDILDTLGSNLQEFFNEESDEKIVFEKDDMFEQIDESYGIKWLVPNAQKNDMEPILCDIEVGHTLFDHESHVGEEFGYVLTGSIGIKLGKKTFKAKKGESFYFKSNIAHKIYNTSSRKSTVIMVSTPPNF